MITRSEKDAIALIESQHAVVKTVSVSPTSDRCLAYVLDQLENPSVKRPTKPLGQVHRHRLFNPKTREWLYRPNEESVRGAFKATPYTKKTSTTLIPADGKMHLFTPKNGDAVGFLFDVKQCHLKDEKYIFPTNASTDTKFWLKDKNVSEANQAKTIPETISLQALQAQLASDRLNGIIPAWNELNIGLSKEAFFAVFATSLHRHDRLKALHAKYEIMEKLGIDLPVLVITPENGVQIYDVEWQHYDLLLTKQYDYVDLPQAFVRALRDQFKKLNPSRSLKQDKQPLDVFVHFLNSEDILPEIKLETLKRVDYATLARLNQTMPNRKIIQLAMEETRASSIASNEKALRAICQFDAYPRDFADILFTPGNEKNWLGHRQEPIRVFLAHLFENSENHDWLFRLATSKKNDDMLALLIKNYVFPRNLEEHKNVLAEIYRHADIEFLKTLFVTPEFNYERFSVSAAGYISVNEGVTCYEQPIKLSPILLTAIYRDEAVLKEVATQFPEKLVGALNELKKYNKHHNGYWPRSFSTDRTHKMAITSDLGETHAKLLLQLTSQVKSHEAYSLSYKEKRLLENYLLKKVAALNTEDELRAFWNQHKDAIYINQRRHHIFDSIFLGGKKYMTSIKNALFSAIEKKIALLYAPQVNVFA